CWPATSRPPPPSWTTSAPPWTWSSDRRPLHTFLDHRSLSTPRPAPGPRYWQPHQEGETAMSRPSPSLAAGLLDVFVAPASLFRALPDRRWWGWIAFALISVSMAVAMYVFI